MGYGGLKNTSANRLKALREEFCRLKAKISRDLEVEAQQALEAAIDKVVAEYGAISLLLRARGIYTPPIDCESLRRQGVKPPEIDEGWWRPVPVIPLPPQPRDPAGVSSIFRFGIDPTRLGYAICRKHRALG